MSAQIINTVGLLLSFMLGAWVALRARSGQGIIPSMTSRKPKEDGADAQKRHPHENIKL